MNSGTVIPQQSFRSPRQQLSDYPAGSTHSLDRVDEEMVPVLGGTEWEGMRFHHANENKVQFKVHELFTSENFC